MRPAPRPGSNPFGTSLSSDPHRFHCRLPSAGLGYAIVCAPARAGYGLAAANLDIAMVDALERNPAVQGRKLVPVELDWRAPSDIAQSFAAIANTSGYDFRRGQCAGTSEDVPDRIERGQVIGRAVLRIA
jgi:NAD(P)-dependent dehydrogenase (short-subunit alcohol dehydrogenase family)